VLKNNTQHAMHGMMNTEKPLTQRQSTECNTVPLMKQVVQLTQDGS